MKDLLQVPSAEGMQSIQQGLSPSLHPRDGALWRDGRNIEWRDNAVASARGSRLYLSGDNITELAQSFVGGEKLLFFADDTGLYLNRGGADSEFLGGESGSVWHMTAYGKMLIATNQRDTVYYYAGDGLEVLENAPGERIGLVAKLEQYVLMLNIDDEPERVAWSDRDSPLEYSLADPASRSGDLNLRDLGTEIKAVARLGNGLAVYSGDRMGILSVVGGQFVIGFQLLLNGIGAVSKHSVVSLGPVNYGMSRNGIWRSDGAQYTYIDEPAIARFIQERVDWARPESVVAYNNEVSREVVWSYLSIEGTRESVAYNYLTGNWSIHDSGFAAALERDILDFPLVAEGDNVYLASAEQEGRYSWVESGIIDMGVRDLYKRLEAARWGVEGSPTLQIAALESVDGEPDWYYSGEMQSEMPLPIREAPFFIFRIGGKNWRISSMLLKGKPNGEVL